jgi:hypothetical protein
MPSRSRLSAASGACWISYSVRRDRKNSAAQFRDNFKQLILGVSKDEAPASSYNARTSSYNAFCFAFDLDRRV